MKKELKVGDKVRVYGRPSPGCGVGAWAGYVVTPDPGPHPGDSISVRAEFGGKTYDVHPKQCRRVRKRERSEKRERVERWAAEMFSPNLGYRSAVSWSYHEQKLEMKDALPSTRRIVHLVELREGEAVVSRSELARAMDGFSAGTINHVASRLNLPEESK